MAAEPDDVLMVHAHVDGVIVQVQDADVALDAPHRGASRLGGYAAIWSAHAERPDLERAYYRRRAVVSAEVRGFGPLTATLFPGSYFFSLGRQDELLGHAAFDDRYIVKTGDAALLRCWLGPDECDAILSTYAPTAEQPFVLGIDGARLEFAGYSNVEARPTAPARLDAAIEAASFLAARPARLAAWWRTHLAPLGPLTAGAHFGVDDDFAIRIEGDHHAVELTFPYQLPAVKRRGLRTQLRVLRREPSPLVGALWRPGLRASDRPPRSKLRSSSLALAGLEGDDQPAPWLAAALVPVERALTVAAPDALHASAEAISLRWERLVDDVAQLRAAMDVLAALVAPAPRAGAPYR